MFTQKTYFLNILQLSEVKHFKKNRSVFFMSDKIEYETIQFCPMIKINYHLYFFVDILSRIKYYFCLINNHFCLLSNSFYYGNYRKTYQKTKKPGYEDHPPKVDDLQGLGEQHLTPLCRKCLQKSEKNISQRLVYHYLQNFGNFEGIGRGEGVCY